MKGLVPKVGLLVLMALSTMNTIACAPQAAAHAYEKDNLLVVEQADSCRTPLSDAMRQTCAEWERQILASTVRLEFHGPSGGIGHATVIGGRYLVTHNHYPAAAAVLNSGGEGLVTAVSVFKNNGNIVLLKAPLSFFTVAAEMPEMLVLDFKVYGNIGFFDSLGVPSAEYALGSSLSLLTGDEVAQIDWDGSIVHVDWVRVTSMLAVNGIPSLEIDNFVEKGASGGGVFKDGILVGNTSTRQTDRLLSGEIVRRYSVAALNSASVVAP